MQQNVHECLSKLGFGEMQVFERMAVIPLISEVDIGPPYVTLSQAMDSGALVVTEVGSGSVPELSVRNSGELPVLIIDGEELVGAKQNRVVNTTILVPEKTQTTIPVSCTEAGRWGAVSPTFADSGLVMPRTIRSNKNASVSQSLHAGRSYVSNQGKVWSDIADLSADEGVSSPTSAMRDVYQRKQHALEDYTAAFQPIAGQRGLLAFVGGRVAGFDYVSRPGSYSWLHNKLVKSYAMDAMRRGAKEGEPSPDAARQFLQRIEDCDEAIYPSVGHGRDHRYSLPDTVGSALVHQACVIHAAFLALDPREDSGRMQSRRTRADYRRL